MAKTRETGCLERMNVSIAGIEAYASMVLSGDNGELAKMFRGHVEDLRADHTQALEAIRALGGRI